LAILATTCRALLRGPPAPRSRRSWPSDNFRSARCPFQRPKSAPRPPRKSAARQTGKSAKLPRIPSRLFALVLGYASLAARCSFCCLALQIYGTGTGLTRLPRPVNSITRVRPVCGSDVGVCTISVIVMLRMFCGVFRLKVRGSDEGKGPQGVSNK
jgi:hypothetical protein